MIYNYSNRTIRLGVIVNICHKLLVYLLTKTILSKSIVCSFFFYILRLPPNVALVVVVRPVGHGCERRFEPCVPGVVLNSRVVVKVLCDGDEKFILKQKTKHMNILFNVE